MAVRPIDGNILRKWCEKIIDQACHPATVQIGEVFLDKETSMRLIDANELLVFPYSESAGTDEQIEDWIEECGLSDEEVIDRAKKLCWMVIEGFVNVIKTAPTLTPPNEPLTQADLNEMYLNEVWLGYPDGSGETALVVSGKIYSTSSIEGAGLDLDEYIMGETLNNPTGNYKVYRRPPEGEADA